MQIDQLFDRAALLDQVEGDEELLAEMMQLYVEDAPRTLEAARNALRQKNMQALERAAHSLKGSASSLTANTVADAATQLEQYAKHGDIQGAESSLAGLESAVRQLLRALAAHGLRVTK